ncbi:terpene synthase family protein [Aureispira anguillae]|nr:terpene synthase family protein [Aureispira anguillae]
MKERNQKSPSSQGNSKANHLEVSKNLQHYPKVTFPISPFHSQQLTISTLKLDHHPAINDILSATSRLSKEFGIQLEQSYASHTSMTAFLYPKSGKYRIVIVNILYDLLYYIDDLFGEDISTANNEEKPSLSEIMNIWKTGKINPEYYNNLTNQKIKNVCDAMQWVRTKLFQSCEPAFFKKISKLLFEHLRDQLKPNAYQNIEEYIHLRRNFSGMYVAIYLIEYCYSRYLTPEILEKVPSLQKAIDLCADIGGLSNDIFSYPKESHSKFNLVNSFSVLNDSISLGQAIQKSIDLVNNCHADFNAAIKQIHTEIVGLEIDQKATVLHFADGLKSILSATYHWQLVTQRYRHDNHILEDLKYQSDYTFDIDIKDAS